MNKITNPMVSKRHKRKRLTLLRAVTMTLFMALFTQIAQAQSVKLKMTNGTENVPADGFLFYDSGGPLLFTPGTPEAEEYNWTTWYQHNEEYTLTLTVPSGGIEIDFSKCLVNNDTLRFYEGNSVNPDNLIGEFCNNEYSTSFCSTSNHFKVVSHGNMTVRFISDYHWRDEGWEAIITRVADYTPQPPVAVMAACDNLVTLIPTSMGTDDDDTNDKIEYKIGDGSYTTYTPGGLIDLNSQSFPVTVTVKATVDGVASDEKAYTFSLKIQPPGVPTYTLNASSNSVTTYFPNKPEGVNDTYYIRWTIDNNPTATNAPSLWQQANHEFEQPNNTPNTVPAGDIDYTNVTLSTPFYIHIATRGTTCPDIFSTVVNIEVTARYVPMPTITFETSGDNGLTTLACSLTGATIYYTTDGSTPITSSTQYNGSNFTVTAGTTVKAIAVKDGYTTSAVASAIFVPGAESGDPQSGTYGGIVLLDDREDHNWSYYSDGEQPIHSLNPADVKITYTGYGNNTMTTTNTAATGLTNSDFNANVASNQVAVNVGEDENQFIYLKTLEAANADGSGNYPYTMIPNPFQVRPTYDPSRGEGNGEHGGNRDEVTIGSGTGYTNGNNLPLSDYYCYSLSQQIFTATEIGTSGTITSVSFNYRESSDTYNRTIAIYMAHTTSSTITSWQTQSSSNLVYSGSRTFTQGWNTITLDTPFEYDGTSNLLLTVDDNTGDDNANHSFYTYSTGANRAIYYRNDNNNPSATGNNSNSPTTSQYNSQLKLNITSGGGGGGCEDFESYSSSAINNIQGTNTVLPTGWSSLGNTSDYKPHLYNGTYSVDGVGIVMTSGNATYGGNNSYLISNITLHEGDEVSFNTFRESASNGTMYYGYITNTSNANSFVSLGTATGVSYSGASASDGLTTFTVPAAANGYKLAWYWYMGSSWYSAVIDNVCVTSASSSSADWRGFYAWRVKSLSSGLEILRADGTQVLVGGYIDADEDIKFRTSNSEGNEVEFEALWAKANVVTCSSANGLSTAIASSSLNANYGYERNFVVVTSGAQTNAITNTSQKPVTITQLYPDGSGTMNSSRYLAGYFTANNDTKFENIYMQNGGMPYTEYTYTYYQMAYYSNTRYYYYSSTYGWYNGYNYGSSYATPYTFTSEDSSLNTNTNYDFGDGTISIDGYSCTILRQITNKTSSTQTTTSTDYYAQGNDLVFGRGITPVTTDGLCAGNIFGLNADATNPHFIMRFESGNFAYIYSMGYTASGHSVSGNPHVKVVLGSDYDRSTSANEILKITNHITGGSNIHFDSGNVTNINYDYIVKSGSVLSSVSVGDGEIENAFYLGGLSGQNVGTQYQGGRRLTIEGGVFKSIAGGYESYGDSNNEGVYIRMRGGEVLGSIYGAAAYAGAFGDREFIFTGGTVNGWIAGGCNGTETDGGYLDGDTYIYFGGKAICTSNGNSTLINSSRGGNIFGAGSGIAGGATVGQVNNSTVVVADAAEVEHNVYGGGNYGFIRPGTNHKSDIYILGGHVHESVFGGANQQEAQIVNIYMKDGIIDGNLYGGSNTKGSVRNESTVNISGGTVTNVFGGGCGQETKMMAGTHVIVSGGTIAENVFGGGELGIVMGNTNVNVSGGTMQNVFGAGKGGSTAANISGNTVVNISGGTISNVYGGGMSGDVTPLATLDDCVATFDGPLPDGWSNIDNDNDGHTWIIGEDSFMSYSYDNATNSALTPNNWIIMQKMVLGDYINFTAKAIDKNYPGDKVSVYVSTTNTNLSSFTQVGSTITAPATNTTYNIDLSSYNGQEGWIAFRHHDCTDFFGVSISNIVVSKSFDSPLDELMSTVTIQGGTINEDVFGGGRLGKTDGDVIVNVYGGNIAGNVYGGAFGKREDVYIAGTHTVNVTGGNMYGNVYGGSRNADDALTFDHTGYTMDKAVNHVNISGGHIYYQVFAGGYFGHTYGSVYAFIGQNAINNAPNAAPTDDVSYNAAALLIDGSVWAGADFGNFDGESFGAATIEGYSNVYVDGDGYNTTSTSPSDAGYMNIGGSVLGCGTSCYAGIMGRDLILRNYGQPVENPNYNGKDDIIIEPYNTATRNMMSVQFFNTAIFDDIHIHLIGQGRINSLSSTEKYSIYEIADSVNVANGSSLFIDYPMDQVKKLGSYTCADVYADSPSFAVVNYTDLPTAGKDNKFRVNNGSYLNVKYLNAYGDHKDYGELEGFFYMMTEDENNTCAYARPKQSTDAGNQINLDYDNPNDGGFLSYDASNNTYNIQGGTANPGVQMPYENHTLTSKAGEQYFRIWRYGGIYSYREGVFDAVASSAAGYSTADVVIALPASRGDGSYFRIKSVEGFPNIDYGTDVMTVNAGVYDATVTDGVHGTPTSTGWMYYNGTTFVEGQEQTSNNLTNALADLNANANVNFGLVAIPQGSLAGGSNVNWLICDAAADENEALATSTWVNNTQVTNPSILFRLTYNNGLDNNAIWDPIIITFEQCDAQGHVKDEITVALSVSISTTIDQSFGTQAYAIMNGQGGQADIYTAKVVLPGFIPWVNTEGDLSDWTFVSATWTPEGSEFTNAWKQGSNYVHDPAAKNEFSMQIVPAANYDNTVGWASYDHTAKDLYYLQNGDPTAQEKHLAYTDARNPAAFDFILHYDGRATCDTKQKMGELVVTLHFTNIDNGSTNHDQNLTITIEVWRRGAGANYYLDGVHGDNFYTGTNPNAAKKTLSGIFNRSDYLPGDNIFIVNTVTANGGSTLDWNGEVYDGVKIYRYPGGHPLDEDQTQAHSTETWDYEEYLEYNPGNKGFTGPLVVVEKSMAIHDIILDGAYNIAVGTPNTTLAPTGYYQVPTAPLINIDANAVLTIYADSKLQWNYSNSNGGAVYNAGKMIIRGGSDINYNAVLADTYKGAGVYVKDGATLIVSDSITIDTNYMRFNDGSKAIVEKNSNVYLESVNSVIQVGTSQQNDGILALENHLTDGSGLKSAKIGVTKGTWGSNYYTPIAYSDGGGSAYLGNLIPENPDAVEAEDYIIYDDDEYYKVVTLNNTSPYEPSSDYLFWVGTWVTKVHEKPSTYTEGATVDIHNANDLAWAISVVNGLNDHAPAPNTNFNVVADIDMDANIWEPMGTSVHKYTGTFNANGHVISGIHSPLNNEYMGMFGYMNGKLQNMIVNVDFSGGNSITMGSVAAHMESGTISNVEAAGTITGTASTETIGGIVAEKTAGSIHSSFAVNSITSANANAHVGGLVGNNAGDLFNSYANVTISGTGQIGGLAGKNNGTIENCYAVVDGQGFPAFAYENAESGTIQYCYADHDNGYVSTTASGTPTPVLQGHGTYDMPLDRKVLGYMYGDNAVTLASGTSTYVYSGDITYTDNHLINWNGLLWSLNKWVNQDATHSSTYTPWFRPTSNLINLDLPVLAFPQDNCLGTLDADGKYLAYGSTHNSANGLDNLLYYFNEDEVVNNAAASLFLYGNATAVTRVPESQVKVFVNEDACLLQADGAGDFINTTVGVTFDNSSEGTGTTWNQIVGEQPLTYDWHFLSSPLQNASLGFTYDGTTYTSWNPEDPSQVSGVSGSYFPDNINAQSIGWDIYTFYEPEYHWMNLKRNTGSHFHFDEPHDPINDYENETVFVPGRGYMMAIEQDSYLSNTGTLTNKDFTVKLTRKSPQTNELGCNFIGNPYHAYFDLDEFFAENSDFTCAWVYIAERNEYVPYPDDASSNPLLPSRYLHPHQGFFVKVTQDVTETTATFTKAMATATQDNSYYRGDQVNYPLVNLFAYNEAGQRDFVVVEFNRPEKGGATKMTAQRRAPFTLTAQDGQDEYTILFNDQNTKRVPIRFATTEDGTFTMKWETHHGTFNKLLLIDNITGTTCDMTTNDHYTFEGRATDFANRFYLVVNATDVDEFDADGDYNNFAYFNGSEWIVNGQGQLDLIDMTGRVLHSEYLAGESNRVSFGNVAAGVYVIRFGNKAQKIVIK